MREADSLHRLQKSVLQKDDLGSTLCAENGSLHGDALCAAGYL